MTGKEYLDKLKLISGTSFKYLKLEDLPEYRRKQLGIEGKLFEKYKTIFEDENYIDDYFQNIASRFIASLADEVQKKLKNVCIGVLPSYKVNASAILNIQCDDYVIVLHSQLLAVISQFCEIQWFIYKDFSDGKMNEFIYKKLEDLVNCYNYPNYAIKLKILPAELTKDEFYLLYNQMTIIEMFVIAHELAHIYLGHCQNAHTRKINLDNDNSSVEILSHNKKKEFEADLQAIKWIVEVIRKKENNMYSFYKQNEIFCLEIFQLFHIIEVSNGLYDDFITEAKNMSREESVPEIMCRLLKVAINVDRIVAGKDNSERTHPLAIERLYYIYTNIIELFNDNIKEIALHTVMDAMYFESYDVRNK